MIPRPFSNLVISWVLLKVNPVVCSFQGILLVKAIFFFLQSIRLFFSGFYVLISYAQNVLFPLCPVGNLFLRFLHQTADKNFFPSFKIPILFVLLDSVTVSFVLLFFHRNIFWFISSCCIVTFVFRLFFFRFFLLQCVHRFFFVCVFCFFSLFHFFLTVSEFVLLGSFPV